MASRSPKKPGVKLEDLCFYFDAVERDRLEVTSVSRKTAEVLALRDRLVRLPDAQFDAAIKTLRSLVDDPSDDDGDRPGRQQRARHLYDETRRSGRGGGSGATGKVSPA